MPTENQNHPDDIEAIEKLHRQYTAKLDGLNDDLMTFQDSAYAMGLARGTLIASSSAAIVLPALLEQCRTVFAGDQPALDVIEYLVALADDARLNPVRVAQSDHSAQNLNMVPDDLESRMKAAGMLSVTELLAGAPIDAFVKHAGVNDLATFGQWLEMKRKEYVSLQARFTLDKREDDELYEWVVAHAAVFGEVHINFKSAAGAISRDLLERATNFGRPDLMEIALEELRQLLAGVKS
ncbi:hypothetical protein D3879_14935 [Pseudomonas cavernicola]|uniref:Uncharacterized protein n=1 Tax=Pseudomonas cavernicola TaxID=2320866 RepID=A0A418XEL7_9PSED|nr:hypothetical protein [Pseudomonas cavernicola]RJG10971.1 hypothetical protein D3879_14935 [Pseudomonas cavernicola]